MKTTRHLLIGGGLASGQAARKIREQDPTGAITLVGEEPHVFEKALIATGGRPIRPKLPGRDLPGAHYLRTLEDSGPHTPTSTRRDWGHAEYTGQIAGQNMAGLHQRYDLLTSVWSDIFDLHLEFAGDESEHDQVLLRGHLEDHAFTVLYLKDGALRAYFAINTDAREHPLLQRLIRSGTNIAGKENDLVDPRFAIQGLGCDPRA